MTTKRKLKERGRGYTITERDPAPIRRLAILSIIALLAFVFSLGIMEPKAEDDQEVPKIVIESEEKITPMLVLTIEKMPTVTLTVDELIEPEVTLTVDDPVEETTEEVVAEVEEPEPTPEPVVEEQVVEEVAEVSNIVDIPEIDQSSIDDYTAKYAWAMVDPATGMPTDITLERVMIAESQLANFIDPRLAIAIAMTESRGREKVVGGGYGLSQITAGTGRIIWEDMYGYSGYSTDLLLDGNINITMECKYLEYLKGKHSSVESLLNAYRGKDVPSYRAKVDSWLQQAGTSLAEINANYF